MPLDGKDLRGDEREERCRVKVSRAPVQVLVVYTQQRLPQDCEIPLARAFASGRLGRQGRNHVMRGKFSLHAGTDGQFLMVSYQPRVRAHLSPHTSSSSSTLHPPLFIPLLYSFSRLFDAKPDIKTGQTDHFYLRFELP